MLSNAGDHALAAHEHIMQVASKLCLEMHAVLEDVGPIYTDPPDLPLYHFMVREITGQQLSKRAAAAIWAGVQRALSQADHEERFLSFEDADLLRSCGISRAKAKAIACVGIAFMDGVISEDILRAVGPADRAKALLSVWGIGQWTADMVNIFYFNETDIWPAGDVAVVGCYASIRGRADVHEIALFSPYRSYLARMLWRLRDSGSLG